MKKGQMAAAKTQGRGALLVLSLVCVGLLVVGGVFFASGRVPAAGHKNREAS